MFSFRHSLYNNAYVGGGGNPYGDDFAFRVKTDNAGTSASNQFTINVSGGTFNYNIETVEHSLTGVTSGTTLTFSSPGEYDIRISGTFPNIRFVNGFDKLKLIYTYNFGAVGWTSLSEGFWGCTNNVISPTATGDFSGVISIFRAFLFNSATTIWPELEFPNATSTRGAFRNLGAVTSFPIRNFYSTADATLMFNGTTLPTSDYSDILITQNANNPNNSVTFDGGSSNYDASALSAITNLVSTKLWTITDAGLI